jgi:hypothetical protein
MFESLGIWNWEQWVLRKSLHVKEKHLAYFGGQFIVQFAQTLKISVILQTGKSANCKWISHKQVWGVTWFINCRQIKILVKELSVPPPDSQDLYFHTTYSQPFFTQIAACFWKQWWTYWRSPDYNLVRMTFTFVSAILFGTIFWNLGQKT